MLGSEDCPGEPADLDEFFDIVEASLPNNLLAKIQKEVETNHSDIHEVAVQGKYADVADDGLNGIPETETPFLAAITIGEQAKYEAAGLNDIYHTELLDNTQKQVLAHGYIGLKAFANGKQTTINRAELQE